MEQEKAILALAALAQPTRFETFRLLLQHAPKGLPAGEIARALVVPQNTLSAHLNILSRAGLVSSKRYSRNIIYQAEIGQIRDLTLFLLKDCCGGSPELCAPLIAELAPCCSPQETAP